MVHLRSSSRSGRRRRPDPVLVCLVGSLLPGTAAMPARSATGDALAPVTNSEDRGVVALAFENDTFASADRHYTNGLRIGISPASAATARALVFLADASGLFPDGAPAIGW